MEEMGKGYAEGPAAEEAERRREELAAGTTEHGRPDASRRRRLHGRAARSDTCSAGQTRSTRTRLFASGEAWGLRVRAPRRPTVT